MKDTSIHIHKVVKCFDYNAYIVYHIFVQFHLRTNLFIKYYIIELILILSSLYFLQEIVLLVVINFHYISQVKSHFYMML